MDNREFKGDYRKFLISKWALQEIESFKRPSLLDLENQSNYYKYFIDKFVPNSKDINILEIGCGWGSMLYTLKKYDYSNIDAIDIIPECCNFVKESIGINVICIDIFEFFNENQKKYDVIIAFDVLEHFNKNEIISLMELIYNSLNDKGIFIMKAPYGGSLKGLYIRYSGFTHELAFTSLSINELFKAIGFKEVYCVPEPDFSTNFIKRWIKKFVKQIIGKLFSVDPDFINSTNIIGVGIKANEKQP